ncbi:MAG: hypothetical protein JSS62_02820 [Verrucomicrobia bacterium]|nr:hypothetical protein [Verrucomicrobiota bacterium]MBS0646460.1 hypothetical protein [Verrucomicrobiota bacterium]
MDSVQSGSFSRQPFQPPVSSKCGLVCAVALVAIGGLAAIGAIYVSAAGSTLCHIQAFGTSLSVPIQAVYGTGAGLAILSVAMLYFGIKKLSHRESFPDQLSREPAGQSRLMPVGPMSHDPIMGVGGAAAVFEEAEAGEVRVVTAQDQLLGVLAEDLTGIDWTAVPLEKEVQDRFCLLRHYRGLLEYQGKTHHPKLRQEEEYGRLLLEQIFRLRQLIAPTNVELDKKLRMETEEAVLVLAKTPSLRDAVVDSVMGAGGLVERAKAKVGYLDRLQGMLGAEDVLRKIEISSKCLCDDIDQVMRDLDSREPVVVGNGYDGRDDYYRTKKQAEYFVAVKLCYIEGLQKREVGRWSDELAAIILRELNNIHAYMVTYNMNGPNCWDRKPLGVYKNYAHYLCLRAEYDKKGRVVPNVQSTVGPGQQPMDKPQELEAMLRWLREIILRSHMESLAQEEKYRQFPRSKVSDDLLSKFEDFVHHVFLPILRVGDVLEGGEKFQREALQIIQKRLNEYYSENSYFFPDEKARIFLRWEEVKHTAGIKESGPLEVKRARENLYIAIARLHPEHGNEEFKWQTVQELFMLIDNEAGPSFKDKENIRSSLKTVERWVCSLSDPAQRLHGWTGIMERCVGLLGSTEGLHFTRLQEAIKREISSGITHPYGVLELFEVQHAAQLPESLATLDTAARLIPGGTEGEALRTSVQTVQQQLQAGQVARSSLLRDLPFASAPLRTTEAYLRVATAKHHARVDKEKEAAQDKAFAMADALAYRVQDPEERRKAYVAIAKEGVSKGYNEDALGLLQDGVLSPIQRHLACLEVLMSVSG